MKRYITEFKSFAMRGNVMDLAIGVIIGAAFGKIVDSIVNDVVMPIISMIIGKANFSDLVITVGETQIKYGSFIQSVFNFTVVAFAIFIFIKAINKIKKEKTPDESNDTTQITEEIKLLREIRDNLKR